VADTIPASEGDFNAGPAGPIPSEDTQAAEPSGTHVGKYRIATHLGTGGMGTVVKAYDTKLHRWVALKFMKAAGSETARRYFEREAQLAAGLSHPNICGIYEIGDHDGQPFIAMQYVEGETLHVARRRMTVPDLVRAAEKIGEAVRFAHERKIIHRDLKPSNVMIDKSGQVFVMDFGLAKEQSVEGESLSGSNVLVGTPGYMAPEQAKGKADEQSDVYGLGAILYELVTGRPPFTGESTADILMQVVGQDVVWPRKLNPGLAPDIEAIILRSLEKEKHRRYASVGQFLEDVGAFQQQNPLKHARTPTFGYVLARRIRKQPLLWGTAAALVLAIVGGATFGTWQLLRAKHEAEERVRVEERGRIDTEAERQKAVESEQVAQAERKKAVEREQEAIVQKNVATEWTRRADTEAQRAGAALLDADRNMSDACVFRADMARRDNNLLDAIAYLSGARAIVRGPRVDAVTFAIPRPMITFHRSLPIQGDWTRSVAFSPDGRTIAAGGGDGSVKLWDVEKGHEVRAMSGHTAPVAAIAYSSRLLASASWDKTARVWDAVTGKPLVRLAGHREGVVAVAFSPNAGRLATGSFDGTVKVWDVRTGAEEATLRGHENAVACVAFSGDGSRVVSGGFDWTVRVWDTATWQCLHTLKGHQGTVKSIAFRDNQHVTTAGDDRSVRCWDPQTGQALHTVGDHKAPVVFAAYVQREARLVLASSDRTVRLWDMMRGRPIFTLDVRGSMRPTFPVAVSPDGRTLATGAGGDTGVRLWRISSEPDERILTVQGSEAAAPVTAVSYSSDGRSLAASDEDGRVRLWDPVRRTTLITLTGSKQAIHAVAFQPGTPNVVASAGVDGVVALWDAPRNRVLRELKGHAGAVNAIAFPPDGRLVITGGADGSVKIWDASDGTLRYTVAAHGGGVCAVAVHPGGTMVATAGEDGAVKLWDREGVLLRSYTGHERAARSVAFSPDGRFISSGGRDLTVRVWGKEEKPLRVLYGHTDSVHAVTFSPDGEILASGDAGGTIKLWDAGTGRELCAMLDHQAAVTSLAFSPDGRTLASGSSDRTLVLWGGCVPETPDRVELITGAALHALELTPIPSARETELQAQFPKPAALPLPPDPDLADYWRAVWSVRRSGTGDTAETTLAPLRDWLDDHPDHPMTPRALEELLLRQGYSRDLPPGWRGNTESKRGESIVLSLKGPDTASMQVNLLPSSAEKWDAADRRDFLLNVVASISRRGNVPFVARGDASYVVLPGGLPIQYHVANLRERPQLAVAYFTYEGFPMSCVVMDPEPEARLQELLSPFKVLARGARVSPDVPENARYAVMKTSHGEISIEFLPKEAPATVANFLRLARRGYYDGLTFHRVIKDFVMQGGCPRGDGTGGPGYSLKVESSRWKHKFGTVAMAHAADLNSAGSQFYICLADLPFLDNAQWAIFGRVIEGFDTLRRVESLAPPPSRAIESRPREPVIIESIRLTGTRPGSTPLEGAEAHLKRALERMSRDDFEGAVADLTRAIEVDPKNALAMARRGESRWELDDVDAAFKDLTQAIEAGLQDAHAFAYRGTILCDRKQYDEAIADHTRAIEVDPLYAFAHTSRGETKRLKGDSAGAIADLTRAIELDAKDAWAWRSRGAANVSKEAYASAISDLTKSLELRPRHAWAHFQRGEAKRMSGDYAGAIPDYTAAIELSRQYTSAYGARGQAYRQKGDPSAAIADLSKAIDLNPDYAWAFAQRGLSKSAVQDRDGAIADFTRAIELKYAPDWLFEERANARRMMEDYEGAIADFSRALEIDPKRISALGGRGQARRQMMDFYGSIADLTAAVECAQPKPYPWAMAQRGLAKQDQGRDPAGAIEDFNMAIKTGFMEVWVWVSRAEVRTALGDPDGAIKDLDEVIGRNPRYAEALRARAEARRRKGDRDGALADLNEAVTLAPKDARALRERGTLHLERCRPAEAVDDLSKALAIDPKDASALASRGEAKRRAGNLDGAIGDLTRALQLRPADPRVLLERGLARALRGDHDGALADLAGAPVARGWVLYARREWATALAAFKAAPEESADCARLWIWLTRVRLGERDAATAEWKAHLAERGGEPYATAARVLLGESPTAEPVFYAALRFVIDGDAEGARAALERCVASKPDAVEAALIAAAELKALPAKNKR